MAASSVAVKGREVVQQVADTMKDISTSSGRIAGREAVRVTALVDLGVRELNRRTVIVPLRAAQNLLALPGGATNLDLDRKSVV